MIRWILNDEMESSIHHSKKKAIKEFSRLKSINYRDMDSLELLRHDTKIDEYRTITI